MARYYFRSGSLTAGTYDITQNKWALEVAGFPPPATTSGTIAPLPADFSNPANEFILDQNSGGSPSGFNCIINVTSNLTIASLTIGLRKDQSGLGYFNGVLNVNSNVTLTISNEFKLPNDNSTIPPASGSGASFYFNTNNTGKISIGSNVISYFSIGTGNSGISNGGICPVSSGTQTTSIIEFAGTGATLIRPRDGISNDVNTSLKIRRAGQVLSPTSYIAGKLRIDFNKPGSALPSNNVFLSSTTDRFITNLFTDLILNSDYNSTKKSNYPNMYGNLGYIEIYNNPTFSCTLTTDTKEISFNYFKFAAINNSQASPIINNSLSSFKVQTLVVEQFVSGIIGDNSNQNTIVEVSGDISKNTVAGSNNLPFIAGTGTLKFVGSTNTTITGNLTNSTPFLGYEKNQFTTNIEVAKTGSGKVTMMTNSSNNLKEFYWQLPALPTSPTSRTFKHTSGTIECDNFYATSILDTAKKFVFEGNTLLNTCTNLFLATSNNDSTGTSYEINNVPLKVQNLEILSGAIANTYGRINIYGNRGFTVNNFIHTSSLNNSNGRINIVTLSSDTTAIYTVTNSITMLGLANRRAILQGNTVSKISNFNASASGTTLTTTTNPPLTNRHYISQSPSNTFLLKRTPSPTFTGSNVTLQSSFAKIDNPVSANTWTLNRDVGTITARNFEAGIPAVFKFTGLVTNLNIDYATTFDIDSSGATTIKANNSYQNRVGIPNPNLWRTINWDSLNPLLPHVVPAYVD
jgi:hypothetical protein